MPPINSIHPLDPRIIDTYIQTETQIIPLILFAHNIVVRIIEDRGIIYDKSIQSVVSDMSFNAPKFDMSTDLIYNFVCKLDLCAYAVSQLYSYHYVKVDLRGFVRRFGGYQIKFIPTNKHYTKRVIQGILYEETLYLPQEYVVIELEACVSMVNKHTIITEQCQREYLLRNISDIIQQKWYDEFRVTQTKTTEYIINSGIKDIIMGDNPERQFDCAQQLGIFVGTDINPDNICVQIKNVKSLIYDSITSIG